MFCRESRKGNRTFVAYRFECSQSGAPSMHVPGENQRLHKGSLSAYVPPPSTGNQQQGSTITYGWEFPLLHSCASIDQIGPYFEFDRVWSMPYALSSSVLLCLTHLTFSFRRWQANSQISLPLQLGQGITVRSGKTQESEIVNHKKLNKNVLVMEILISFCLSKHPLC